MQGILNCAPHCSAVQNDEMAALAGHSPTKQEIAYRLGVPVNKLTQIIKSAQSTISMETPANSSEDSSKIADFIVDEESRNVFENALAEVVKEDEDEPVGQPQSEAINSNIYDESREGNDI